MTEAAEEINAAKIDASPLCELIPKSSPCLETHSTINTEELKSLKQYLIKKHLFQSVFVALCQ